MKYLHCQIRMHQISEIVSPHLQGWMKTMSEHKHLHPIAIFFNAVRIVREAIIPIGAGFLSFRGESFIYFLLGLAAFLIILLRSEERRVGKECSCRWTWCRAK